MDAPEYAGRQGFSARFGASAIWGTSNEHPGGAFHDLADVKSAITLAIHLLERAEELARKNGKP